MQTIIEFAKSIDSSKLRGMRGVQFGLNVDNTWRALFATNGANKLTDDEIAETLHNEFPAARRDYRAAVASHRAMFNRGSLVCQGGVAPEVECVEWVVNADGDRVEAPKRPAKRTRAQLEARIAELETLVKQLQADS